MRAGDLYTLHHEAYKVKHPVTGKSSGTRSTPPAGPKVVLVNEDTAIAVVEQACKDIHDGDYLKPIEKVNVPMVVPPAPPSAAHPPTGSWPLRGRHRGRRHARGSGPPGDDRRRDRRRHRPGQHLLHLPDHLPVGALAPRRPRRGAILSVREKTALGKVTDSSNETMVGDQVELR